MFLKNHYFVEVKTLFCVGSLQKRKKKELAPNIGFYFFHCLVA